MCYISFCLFILEYTKPLRIRMRAKKALQEALGSGADLYSEFVNRFGKDRR